MELLRIGLAPINATVGDLEGNANRIIGGIERATGGLSPLDRKNGEGIVRCIRKCGRRGYRRGK